MLTKFEVLRSSRHQDRGHPFDSRSSEAVRVVVDPRLRPDEIDPILGRLLQEEDFEVATVGRSADDTIQIDESRASNDVVPVTFGTTRSGIRPWSNLRAYAAGWAKEYNVDRAELEEALILLAAAETWSCDFFISDSPGLATPAGRYRAVTVLNQENAVPALGLLLRRRENCLVAADATQPLGQLYPSLFYLVSTAGCIPEVFAWARSCYVSPDPSELLKDDGDIFGLRLYEDLPFDGVKGRFAHALRARDRVLQTLLAGGGNENSDLIVYELQSLALNLSGALDSAATVVAQQLRLPGESNEWSWQGKQPRPTMRLEWGVNETQTTVWKQLAQTLALVRNQIHGAVLQTIEDDKKGILVVLPRKTQDKLRTLMASTALGGAERWGLPAQGPAFLDPWAMAEAAVSLTRDALREIASIGTRDSVPEVTEVWPFDAPTLSSAVVMLGLKP